MSKKILITGGLGSIGFILRNRLINENYEVYILDTPHSDINNYLRCDVGSFYQLLNIFKKHKFDFVFHLGAEFGRWNGEDFYETMWRSNAIGTKNIIKLQEEFGFKMLFTSSSEVYGDYEGIMKEEIVTEQFIRPMNDYAISKLVNEIQILNSEDMFKTETVRVRIFNTFGPGEYYSTYRSVLCRFVYSALHDLEYTVYKNHMRTSTYITDIVEGLYLGMKKFNPGNVYNLAGNDYHTIEEASDLITKILDLQNPKVKYEESEKFTTINKKTDISKATKELGFFPKVGLEEGLKKLVTWMDSYYIKKNISKSDVIRFL